MPRQQLSEVQRTFHVRDGRGRLVPMLDPYTLLLLRRHDVIPAEPLSIIAKEIGSGLDSKTRRFLTLLIALSSISALVLVVLAIDVLWHREYGRLVEKGPMFLCQMWFWPLIFWVNAKRVRYKRIQAVMLKHRYCPHCGYDLRGLPTHPADGHTICPECGSAWHLTAAAGDSPAEEQHSSTS